jgi:hypothetical protein
LGLGLVFLGAIGGSASAQPPTEENPAVGQVTICHRDNDTKKPYVEQTISTSAAWNRLQKPPNNVVGVFPTTPWGDIIPWFLAPKPPGDGKVHSLNWSTDGQAIWKGGCLVDLTAAHGGASGSTSSTTAPEHHEATTVPPTAAPEHHEVTTNVPEHHEATTVPPTAAPEHHEVTTTVPEHHEATTVPPTAAPETTATPTTAPASELPPPVTNPGAAAKIVPATEAVVVDPGDHVVDLGMLTVSERKSLDAEVAASAPTTTTTITTTTTTTTTAPPTTTPTQPPAPLAGTGVNVVGKVLTALALISAGSVFYVLSRRTARPGND